MLSGGFLAHAITQMYPSFDLPVIDIVTNVPAHFIRPILRLCDPPKQFAKSIGKTYDIKYQSLLSRKSNKHANRKSSRETRMKVAQNNFFAKDIDIRGMSILLVDDVITTGATTHICTNELIKMGAKQVYILSLCCVLSE